MINHESCQDKAGENKMIEMEKSPTETGSQTSEASSSSAGNMEIDEGNNIKISAILIAKKIEKKCKRRNRCE